MAEGHTRDRIKGEPPGGSGSMLPRENLNFSMPVMANLALFAIETTGNENSGGPCSRVFSEQLNFNIHNCVRREGTSMQRAVRLMIAFA